MNPSSCANSSKIPEPATPLSGWELQSLWSSRFFVRARIRCHASGNAVCDLACGVFRDKILVKLLLLEDVIQDVPELLADI